MLDFTQLNVIIFTIIAGVLFLASLSFTIVFAVKKRKRKTAGDVVFSIFNWLFFVITAIFFVLIFIVDIPIAGFTFASVPILGEILLELTYLYLGIIIAALPLAMLFVCGIVHAVKLKKVSKTKQSQKSIKEAIANSQKVIDLERSIDECEKSNGISAEKDKVSQPKSGGTFDKEFLDSMDEDAFEVDATNRTHYKLDEMGTTTVMKMIEENNEIADEKIADESKQEEVIFDTTTQDDIAFKYRHHEPYEDLAQNIFDEVREFARTVDTSDENRVVVNVSKIEQVAKTDKQAEEVKNQIPQPYHVTKPYFPEAVNVKKEQQKEAVKPETENEIKKQTSNIVQNYSRNNRKYVIINKDLWKDPFKDYIKNIDKEIKNNK